MISLMVSSEVPIRGVKCRYVDEITGSSILNILPDFLQLEVNCFWFIEQISGDKGKGHMDIVEENF